MYTFLLTSLGDVQSEFTKAAHMTSKICTCHQNGDMSLHTETDEKLTCPSSLSSLLTVFKDNHAHVTSQSTEMLTVFAVLCKFCCARCARQ